MIFRLIEETEAFHLSGGSNLESASVEWQKCQGYRCRQVAEMGEIRGVKSTVEIPPCTAPRVWTGASTHTLADDAGHPLSWQGCSISLCRHD